MKKRAAKKPAIKKNHKSKSLLKYLIWALLLIALLLGIFFVFGFKNVGEVSKERPLLAEGEINPTTGMPLELEKLKNITEKLTDEEKRNEYLKQEWGKILAKNKYIGPIHNFFVKNPLIFTILFNEPYNFSLKFICIIILWIFFLAIGFSFAKALGIKSFSLSFLAGIVFAIFFAQITIIGAAVDFTLSLIFSKEQWWMRLILGAVAFFAIVILYYLSSATSQAIEKARKKRKEQEGEENLEKLERVERGAGLS